ncbi:MAG: hypothetical protein M3297_14260 [Thermoproteota archaeon]|nr:hypothetical protein [Thermoproteota archaeon]
MNNIIAYFVIIPGLSILLFSFLLLPVEGSTSVNIFPPGSKPYGLPYSAHIENFWKWILSIPAKDNPINDPTGEKCATGQSNTNSSLFYLAFNNGGISERTCKVPAGKGLFIPVMQVELTEKDVPGATIEELKLSAKTDQDSVNSLYLKIGDKEYNFEDLRKYRTDTDGFEVDYADNGIFGIVEGGPTTGVADGYYIMTDPLQRGNYTVHYKSSLSCLEPGCAEPNFAQDIRYNIIAE